MTLPQRTLAWSLFWLTLAPVRAQRVPPDQALVVSDFSTLTSKDLISPFPIHIVNPLFPSKAKKKDAQGEIVLRGVIATDGSVRDVSVVSGNSSLSGVAIEAVRHWQYLPAIQNGKPIEVPRTIKLKYDLSKGASRPHEPMSNAPIKPSEDLIRELQSGDLFRVGPGITPPKAPLRAGSRVHGTGSP